MRRGYANVDAAALEGGIAALRASFERLEVQRMMSTRSHLITLTSVLLLGASAGCASKGPEADIRPAARAAASAPSGADAAAPATTTAQAIAQVAANLERIHFEYDSERLTADSLKGLADNARILAAHREISVEIQGHADARGTTEYNLALGQRRAESVVAYLTRSGVPATQVRSVSFGKEKPRDARDSEEAWAQNRRVEFRVLEAPSIASVRGTVED